MVGRRSFPFEFAHFHGGTLRFWKGTCSHLLQRQLEGERYDFLRPCKSHWFYIVFVNTKILSHVLYWRQSAWIFPKPTSLHWAQHHPCITALWNPKDSGDLRGFNGMPCNQRRGEWLPHERRNKKNCWTITGIWCVFVGEKDGKLPNYMTYLGGWQVSWMCLVVGCLVVLFLLDIHVTPKVSRG